MDINLTGKTAVITGGLKGIGAAIAEEFAKSGANIAVISRTVTKEKKSELNEFYSGLGAKAEFYECDVADYEKCEKTVETIISDFGGIDILVNNAGITRDGLFVKMDSDAFNNVISTNLTGTFNMSRHVGRYMFRKKSGCIINLSSVVGIYGNAGQANYSASKAGVIGLTKSLAKELGPRGIRVNAIAPGFIETDMTGVLSDELKAQMLQRISIKRFGQTNEVADLALFLASEHASYISGQVIEIDGCMSV